MADQAFPRPPDATARRRRRHRARDGRPGAVRAASSPASTTTIATAPRRSAPPSTGGDLRLAHRMAHTLKGAAGMIGAHRGAAAGQRARTGAARTCAARHAAAIAALGVVAGPTYCKRSRCRLAGGTGAGMPRCRDAAAPARRCWRNWRGCCTAATARRWICWKQSGASLKAALGEARFSAVALAVNEFDFEGALAALGRRDGRGWRRA